MPPNPSSPDEANKSTPRSAPSGLLFKSDNQQYIFQNKYNGLTNPSQSSRWLKKLYNECDIKHITVHGLRHTHCTLGLQSRAYTIEEMMNRLEHKDIKVTMDVYMHVTHETMESNPKIYREYLKSASIAS